MYWLDNTKPQGLSNCRADVSQEQHNLLVKLLQIWNSAFATSLAPSKCRHHFLISLVCLFDPHPGWCSPGDWEQILNPYCRRQGCDDTGAEVQASPCHWLCALWLTPGREKMTPLEKAEGTGAPSETLLTSAYETHTEISGAFLLGYVMVKTNSG